MRSRGNSFAMFMGCLVMLAGSGARGQPPFSGTIFIDPDIITASDPSTFTQMSYAGQGMRVMYDRRVANWITVNAYLFNASFDDGLSTEIQVNPEFGSATAASVEANKYAVVIGRLPTISRMHVQTVWIHQGVQPFGGGNNNLLIHTGQSALYEADGILEETFVHESGHTSLDAAHASSAGWLAAQAADPEFISTYARDNPTREDIAESYLPWLAIRHRRSRISASLYNTITSTIPNRIAYFDSQNFNMYPIVPRLAITRQPVDASACAGGSATFSVGINISNAVYRWQRRNAGAATFTNVPNATNASYTLPSANAADDGAGFRVIVSGGGANLLSTVATLVVVAVVSPTVAYSFDGPLANATLYGHAYLGNNALELHPAAGGRSGALLTDDLVPNRRVRGFSATFRVQMISGLGYADGFSFNWGTDLPIGPYAQAEEGAGNGLRVCFDTYDNGGGEAPAIDVKWGSTTIGHYTTTNGFLPGSANDFAEVGIRLHTNGTIDVTYRCLSIFTKLPLPEYTPLTGARFGLGARTGSLYESHTIDDLALQLIADPLPPRLQDTVRLGNGHVQFSFTNAPGAIFTVMASADLSLPLDEWTVLGAPTESPAGEYRFTDTQTAVSPQRFYAIRSP